VKAVSLAIGVIAAGSGGSWLAAWRHASAISHAPPSSPDASKAPRITRNGASGIAVPHNIAENLRLKTGVALQPTEPIHIPPFQGVLALDSNGLQRVHARFAGEIVSLESKAKAPVPQVGDKVEKGQLLAVIWSKDLGEKKSELVDAISKLKADEQVLARLKELFRDGGTPERSLRDAERAVQTDRVAVERAERTLRSWRVTDTEIAAVRAEANRLSDPNATPPDPANWARVEVLANQSGTILEKNVTVGDIVDTSTDLFKIGDLSHLVVWANVYEEDLQRFTALPKPLRWKVSVPSRPGSAFPGTLDHVGDVIDPNQHTALVSGKVENPDGELKIGQFVTVSVDLPAPSNELIVPVDAVVEDGKESVVFVQPNPAAKDFVRCPVQVTRRTRDTIFLRAESPGVKAGDIVVTSGALILREAMDALPPEKSLASK
jgi:cobalt-zinc-cadmium efflux system membrane fusion protein